MATQIAVPFLGIFITHFIQYFVVEVVSHDTITARSSGIAVVPSTVSEAVSSALEKVWRVSHQDGYARPPRYLSLFTYRTKQHGVYRTACRCRLCMSACTIQLCAAAVCTICAVAQGYWLHCHGAGSHHVCCLCTSGAAHVQYRRVNGKKKKTLVGTT